MKIQTLYILINLIIVIVYLCCQLRGDEVAGKILVVILCAVSWLFIYFRSLMISCTLNMRKLDSGLKRMNEKFMNIVSNREIVEHRDDYTGQEKREIENPNI